MTQERFLEPTKEIPEQPRVYSEEEVENLSFEDLLKYYQSQGWLREL